jgi:hypothetical protein
VVTVGCGVVCCVGGAAGGGAETVGVGLEEADEPTPADELTPAAEPDPVDPVDAFALGWEAVDVLVRWVAPCRRSASCTGAGRATVVVDSLATVARGRADAAALGGADEGRVASPMTSAIPNVATTAATATATRVTGGTPP